jgi:ABC-type nitrate/sulfonate/bicarbonate transport system substrate-binding protein
MKRHASLYMWVRTKRPFSSAILAIALAAPLCASAADTIRVLFPTPPQTLAIPHYVAIDKGFHQQVDLEARDIHLADDATALRALLAGNGDVAVVGNSTAMLGIIGGAKVKAIGSWQPRVDYQLITAKNAPDKIGPGLVGLKFAGAGGGNLLNVMFAMVLRKHGLPTKNETVAVGGHSDRLAALVSGKADVTLVNTLTATRAGNQVNVVTPIAKELGEIGYVYLVVNEKDLSNPARRAVLSKFMKASMLGARHAVGNAAEAAAALNKRVPELKIELITDIVRQLNQIPVWGVNGGAEPEITAFTAKGFYEYKEIGRPMKTEEILDRRVVEPILKEIGVWKRGS